MDGKESLPKEIPQTTKILTLAERDFYLDQGYVVKQNAIGSDWIARLNTALNGLVDRSRSLTRSNEKFDLEPGHSAENPRLRRIAYLDDLDPIFWDFCRDSPLTDMAADLLGPNIYFREAMANIKWKGGGQEVKWHQDLAFYPLTNRSVAQFLVLLDDVGMEQGPLRVVPESHKGPFYDHYDDDDNWLGFIPNDRLSDSNLGNAVALMGPAGTVTAHDAGTLHASDANLSSRSRPVLVITYCACDAIAYTAVPYPTSHYRAVVRGEPVNYARHDAYQIRMPPDWSGGYTSIFEHQDET